MRKFLLLILIPILMTGCSDDKGKVTTDLTGVTSQAPYEAQQPSAMTQTPLAQEPLKTRYPQILTPTSTDRIDYVVNSESTFCI
ncbi:MAG: hypothetical protein K0S61_3779, partial [Anaerocolumna sp.]|nr:hypothetical protein [Anaerocolumna sp.]